MRVHLAPCSAVLCVAAAFLSGCATAPGRAFVPTDPLPSTDGAPLTNHIAPRYGPPARRSMQAPDDPKKSNAELAKKTQNPVADLVSLPFQNNINFGVGPGDDVQNVLNIQPVVPMKLNDDWNLISRVIAPLIYQPEFVPGEGSEFGLGDLTYTAFFSPRTDSKTLWGAGPVIQMPTATDDRLGAKRWGIGPSAVVLTMPGKWVIGGLINNVWSVGGSDRPDINQMLVQPFVNYNFGDGWYALSAPIITANWEADSDQRWVVPIGGGAGKVFRLGRLPVNTTVQGYYNVEHPDFGAEWTLRLQVQFLF